MSPQLRYPGLMELVEIGEQHQKKIEIYTPGHLLADEELVFRPDRPTNGLRPFIRSVSKRTTDCQGGWHPTANDCIISGKC